MLNLWLQPNKGAGLLITFIFLASVFSFSVLAQETADKPAGKGKALQKAADTRAQNLEALKDLRAENLNKVRALNNASVRKLASIATAKAERIANLSKERLERVAVLNEEKLNRIASLNTRAAEKISDLDAVKMRRVTSLDETGLAKVASLDAIEIKKVAALGRAEAAKIANLDTVEIRERLVNVEIKKIRAVEDLNKRRVDSLSAERLEARYKAARENYATAKNKFEEARKQFADEKPKRVNVSIENLKTILTNAADRMLNHLDAIKSRVNASANIDEERANSIIAEIDGKAAEITAIKTKIGPATTKDELKNISKELRATWSGFQHKPKIFAERVIAARTEGLVNKARVLETRLDEVIKKIEEKGVEVDVSAELASFSGSVETAKMKYSEASAKLEQARNSEKETAISLVKEANTLLKESRDAIKVAHSALVAMAKKIRAAGAEIEIDETSEVEVAEEA
ncbi:MAG: hypothetical protein HY517_01045 [Candidatus Aenigmarchaeota archaeon]|nr:hypothetical protein [Candidatus Aenigmarchaeota archaeon]